MCLVLLKVSPTSGFAGSVNNFHVGKEPGLKVHWAVCPFNSGFCFFFFLSPGQYCILPIILPSPSSYWSYVWWTVGHSSVTHRQMSVLLSRHAALCWQTLLSCPDTTIHLKPSKYPSVSNHLVNYGYSHAGAHWSCSKTWCGRALCIGVDRCLWEILAVH